MPTTNRTNDLSSTEQEHLKNRYNSYKNTPEYWHSDLDLQDNDYQCQSVVKSQLSSTPYTAYVKNFCSVHQDKDTIDQIQFGQDLKQIFQFMNCPYDERESILGHKFFGLHYNDDILRLLQEHNVRAYGGTKLQLKDMKDWKPDCWERDNLSLGLTYNGVHPSEALDALFRGPTVLDCGMAMQVAFLMAIKKQIGNERFDRDFGKRPLHITQYLWEPVHLKQLDGNPFYDFFDPNSSGASSIILQHFSNDPTYGAKHGGGNHTGHNTFYIGGDYLTFDPNGAPCNADSIKSALVNAYNELPSREALELHETWRQDSEKAPEWARDWIDSLKQLEKRQISQSQIKQEPPLALDLVALNAFLSQSFMSQRSLDVPIDISCSPGDVPPGLLKSIPTENREMDLLKYKKGITQPCQEKAHQVAQYFISRVLQSEPCFYTLKGPAGIGKTAIAVAAAKELAKAGKSVLFLSEIQLSKLTAAFSLKQSLNLDDAVDEILSGYDVIFMDDNNLSSLTGKTLEKRVLKKFFEQKQISVFKTSNLDGSCNHFNEQIKYDGSVDPGVNCPAYTDKIWTRVERVTLDGKSLRKGFDTSKIVKESEQETLTAFLEDHQGCHTAIVLQDEGCNCGALVGYSKSPVKYIPLTEDILNRSVFELHYTGLTVDYDYLKELVEQIHDLDPKKLILVNETDDTNQQLLESIISKARKDSDIRFLERLTLMFGCHENYSKTSKTSSLTLEDRSLAVGVRKIKEQTSFEKALQAAVEHGDGLFPS